VAALYWLLGAIGAHDLRMGWLRMIRNEFNPRNPANLLTNVNFFTPVHIHSKLNHRQNHKFVSGR